MKLLEKFIRGSKKLETGAFFNWEVEISQIEWEKNIKVALFFTQRAVKPRPKGAGI